MVGGGADATTWEDVTTIKHQFSDFNLKDKVACTREGNVSKLNVYVRRKKINS